MTQTLYQEWRTVNSTRRYPFADDTSLTTTDGFTLPDDVFIDGFFYPININEPLYLAELNKTNGTLTLKAGTAVVATGTASDGIIEFVDTRDRKIGMLVYTDKFDSISGKLEFANSSAVLATACVMPQNQPGVRGFRMPDGTILTGEVTFEGVDGVRIDSRIEDDKHILRISAVGDQEPPECVDLPPPLECIDVNQLNEGSLVISRIDNQIFIGHRALLEDACDNKTRLPEEDDEGEINLPPLSYDPCDGPPPDEPCDDSPPWTPPGDCPEDAPFYFFSPAGDLLQIMPYTDAELGGAALLDYIYNPVLPPRQAQGLIIGLRNLEVD